MSGKTTCDGRHVCDPDWYPTELGQEWDCPECGAHHVAFDVHAEYSEHPRHQTMLKHVPFGTLGWKTSGATR